MYFRMLGRWG